MNKKVWIAVSVALSASLVGAITLLPSTLNQKAYNPDDDYGDVTDVAKDKEHIERPISVDETVILSNVALSKTANINNIQLMDKPTLSGGIAPTTDTSIKDNSVKRVADNPISTFSADADDGSYKLFKANLNKGLVVEKDLIRVEEFINAFDYKYPKPSDSAMPFSTSISVSPSPWSDNYLLRVGIKGYEHSLEELPPTNLTFLVDVSGSMKNNMPIIKSGLKMLVGKLRPSDRVSIVTYAGETKVALPNTKVSDMEVIKDAIDSMSSGGSTNGQSGIDMAYKENEKNTIDKGINRVILMSDGDFNVGIKVRDDLVKFIEEKRDTGVSFSTIGIGGDNFRDDAMESMANKGNGVYTFIGDAHDAREVFADRFIQTIKTIAKDVKYQVEFNPANVKEYRLIGYENRLLNDEDFKNDNVDAGELPSGASTTAIYEITLSDQEGLHPDKRYESKKGTSDQKEKSNELAELKIAYKLPDSDYSEYVSFVIDKDLISRKADANTVFASHVAGFAQLLRDSKYLNKDYTYESVLKALDEVDLDKERQRFYHVVETANVIISNK
tara:strand:- start:11253 stop:12923 length:1671 start_codon:yes stop_codon:yes gene_type:complete